MSEIGHNGHLAQFVSRIERLDEELRAINTDKKEVYSEAKATGFDTKILKKIIAERRKDPGERAEEEALMDLYRAALGMVPTDAELGIESITLSRVHAHEDASATVPSTSQQAVGGGEGEGAAAPIVETSQTPLHVAAPEPDLDIPPFLDRRTKP